MISEFMEYSGFELENSYSDEGIIKSFGEEYVNEDGKIEYNSIYEYLSKSKIVESVLSKEVKEEKHKITNHKNIDYVSMSIIASSLALWILNFMIIPGTYIFKCAKGFGLNLRIWSIILSLLMCRTLINGKISKHTEYHVLIGYIYTISSLGHTTFHFINGVSNNIQYITGYILFGISVLMGISSYFRHSGYNIFVIIHRLNYIILTLLILHVKELWLWFVIGLIIVGIEFLYNTFNRTQISTLSCSRISKYQNIIYLSFNRVIQNVPGSYYRIMIPSINYEWHSFSVANCSPSDQLLFIISIRGDWTKELENKLKSNSNDIVFVMGPFITASCNILNDETKKILCIAGGIGIAPFISVVDTKVQLNRINDEYRSNYLETFEEKMLQQQSFTLKSIKLSFNRKSKEKLSVIWIIREPEHLIKYIDDIINSSEFIDFTVYITGKFDKTDELKHKWNIIKLLRNSNIKCFFYKPNIYSIIKDYSDVFFCGSKRLEDDVKNSCYINKVKFHCEKFD